MTQIVCVCVCVCELYGVEVGSFCLSEQGAENAKKPGKKTGLIAMLFAVTPFCSHPLFCYMYVGWQHNT